MSGSEVYQAGRRISEMVEQDHMSRRKALTRCFYFNKWHVRCEDPASWFSSIPFMKYPGRWFLIRIRNSATIGFQGSITL